MNAYWPDGLKPKRATLCPLDRSLGLVSILWSGHIVHKREVFKRMKRNLLIEFSYNFLWFVFSKENNGRISQKKIILKKIPDSFSFPSLSAWGAHLVSLFLRNELRLKEKEKRPNVKKETISRKKEKKLFDQMLRNFFRKCIWSCFFLSNGGWSLSFHKRKRKKKTLMAFFEQLFGHQIRVFFSFS